MTIYVTTKHKAGFLCKHWTGYVIIYIFTDHYQNEHTNSDDRLSKLALDMLSYNLYLQITTKTHQNPDGRLSMFAIRMTNIFIHYYCKQLLNRVVLDTYVTDTKLQRIPTVPVTADNTNVN